MQNEGVVSLEGFYYLGDKTELAREVEAIADALGLWQNHPWQQSQTAMGETYSIEYFFSLPTHMGVIFPRHPRAFYNLRVFYAPSLHRISGELEEDPNSQKATSLIIKKWESLREKLSSSEPVKEA